MTYSTPSSIAWPSPQRHADFQAWLQGLPPSYGLRLSSVQLASADASFRRYFRVNASPGVGDQHQSYVIMDAPPTQENCAPFVHIARLFTQAGLRVPEVRAWDQEHGFLLLSDLGQQTMMELLKPDQPQTNQALFRQAVDVLVTLQLGSKPDVLPLFDEAQLRRELALFPEWYVGKHGGHCLQPPQLESLQRIFSTIVSHNLRSPRVYVHCDFMPRNLMPSTDQAMGVLDFQDALYGPISYDIASLVRDAFISWDEDFVLDITIRYWEKARKAGLPVENDFGEFYRSVEWAGLQRHLRIAGVFARLTLRDGKPQYLADVPRFIGYIRATAARYRELTPLLRLIDHIEGTPPVSGFAYGRI